MLEKRNRSKKSQHKNCKGISRGYLRLILMFGDLQIMAKNSRKKIITGIAALMGAFVFLNYIGRKKRNIKNIDDGNEYLKDNRSKLQNNGGWYESRFKPLIDKVLSFAGLALLSPILGVISLAVFLDDPGPILFTQKRVGKDNHFFLLHKFRSMKMETPHDVPTHLLSDPEQYITRVGRILRKTSLDELPQIWDIFVGNMSIIGPRPALWNQEDLVAEREKYGANGVKPGLTGWAQINGRDELEIEEKARLDGEYVIRLRKGGWKAFFQDIKCFFCTVGSVLRKDGVVEGGTGMLNIDVHTVEAVTPSEAGFEDYGCYKHFCVNKTAKKKVLITGAGSYIGESVASYIAIHYPNITIETVDMINSLWREKDFSRYDAVFHVAGIAHADVGRVRPEERKRYYEVNTDLAIEVCKKSKIEGVKQFIFMSSMIIYGDSAPVGQIRIIDKYTIPSPANFYGDSKWQADKGVRKLASESFKVAVLRPPMIYGRGSKGNYQILEKISRILPFFPKVENCRSMLYIENFCEFVAKLILTGEGGIYFPQNREYSNTSEIVKLISNATEKRIYNIRILSPVVKIAGRLHGKIGGLVNKAFGNSVYSQSLSRYEGLHYQKTSLEESIKKIENPSKAENLNNYKPHILVISQYFHPETFRINDMAAEWVKRGYKVTVLTGIPNYPMGKFFEGYDYKHKRHEQWNGMEIIRIPLIPRGNTSIGMVANYFSFVASGWWWNIKNDVKADFVFTFEVSPMTQALIGCWYAKKHHIPHFLYVQDLWPENVETVTGIHNPAVIKPINFMVNYIYSHTEQIFTTSPSFVKEIVKRGVNKSKVHYWSQYAEEFYKPLDRQAVRTATYTDFIPEDDKFKIAFTGNIGTAQGLDILPKIAEKLDDVLFVIIGDGRYQEQLVRDIRDRDVEDKFVIIPRQPAEMIPLFLAGCDAAFLSFSNTKLWEMTIPAKLQSYMACGMPIIAAAKGETERVIREAKCGVCCRIGDVEGMVRAIESMRSSGLEKFSQNSRVYAKKHYDKTELMDEMDKYFNFQVESEKYKNKLEA